MKRAVASGAASLVAGSLSCAAPQPAASTPAAPSAEAPTLEASTPAERARPVEPAKPAEPAEPVALTYAFPTACRSDADCGYDPTMDRCGSDPRHNRQPPIVDQGILCYCDAARAACALFRVTPTPCEGDDGCAVSLDPRPHPVRASEAHPHERGRPCRDFTIATTCERTNICTMRHLACAARPEDSRRGRKAPASPKSPKPQGASPP